MTDMPFIPEFQRAEERNQWIKDHAQYWTVIYRLNRKNQREECWSFAEAVERAKSLVKNAPTGQLMIYAVAGGHDALAATVNAEGIRSHA